MHYKNYQILSTSVMDEDALKQAWDLGFKVDVINFIETKNINDIKIEQQIEALITQNLFVVFTSKNAVNAVSNYTKNKTVNWKIGCIGNATKRSVNRLFTGNKVTTIGNNAQELANNILLQKTINKVIFFCGEQRLNILPNILLNSNIEVEEIVVYTTVATPKLIEKKYDAIFFYSPSGVDSFFSMNKIDEQTTVVAIGNTTAKALESYHLKNILIAEKPYAASMLEKLRIYN